MIMSFHLLFSVQLSSIGMEGMRDTYGSERREVAQHGDHHHIGAAAPAVHVAGTGDHGGAGHLQLHRDDHREHQGITGPLRHRSGSSSSSSEDDGEGGRRKKGMKEKVKEKLPGVGGTHEHHHEKKSIMEKIKEKLPGSHDHHLHEPSAAAAPNHVHDHEKKGTMEKIKEKLHVHHHH